MIIEKRKTMKKKKENTNSSGVLMLLLGLVACLLIVGCRTAQLAVNDDLKSVATEYAVKGRQGFQIGQVLTFGDYKTSKVNRGWTKSYSLPFVVNFSGAKEKMAFDMFAPDGHTASVAFVSKFRAADISPFGDYFSINIMNDNVFGGGIQLNDSRESWEFVVNNVDGWSNSLKNNTLGFVRSKVDHLQIDIIGIRELEGASKMMTIMNVYGYEFQMDGKVIGTVSTINNGKVWIKDNLHPDLKLVLASVSSGLMLRYNMMEAANDL